MKLMPHLRISNIDEITPELIQKYQIQLLFVDIDNTLASHDQAIADEKTIQWAQTMKQHCRLIFISNNKQKRVQLFCEPLGEYVSFALKPFGRRAYRKAKLYGIEKQHVACVGDQLLTDVLGAHLHGFMAILCEPLTDKDIIYTKLSRSIERIILKRMEKKNEKM